MQPGVHPVLVVRGTHVLFEEPAGHGAIVVTDDQTAVVRVGVGVGEQRDQPPFLLVVADEPVEIDMEQGVGVQKQEVVGQAVLDFEQRAGVPERLLLHEVVDLDAEFAPVAEVVDNGVAEMPDGQEDIGEPLFS